MSYERSHISECIEVTLVDGATIEELLAARYFLQCEIVKKDKEPVLDEPEATTYQMPEQEFPEIDPHHVLASDGLPYFVVPDSASPSSVQSGPVQVVESEPEWSEWFNWSGGENPVSGCSVNTVHVSGVEDVDWANCSWWDHKPPADAFSNGNITRYRVKLSSIPEGYTLSDKGVLRGVPKADWPDWRRGLTLPDGYVWAGFGDGGDIVDTSLCVHECMGLSVISKAGGCLKGVLYALPTNAPQEHFDRFTGDRA